MLPLIPVTRPDVYTLAADAAPANQLLYQSAVYSRVANAHYAPISEPPATASAGA